MFLYKNSLPLLVNTFNLQKASFLSVLFFFFFELAPACYYLLTFPLFYLVFHYFLCKRAIFKCFKIFRNILKHLNFILCTCNLFICSCSFSYFRDRYFKTILHYCAFPTNCAIKTSSVVDNIQIFLLFLLFLFRLILQE